MAKLFPISDLASHLTTVHAGVSGAALILAVIHSFPVLCWTSLPPIS